MGEKTKVDLVANRLRWGIIKGELPNERLPAERDMAESFKVSRATMRAALLVLRAEGLVESTPGISWRRAKDLDNVRFELVLQLFDELEPANRPAFIQWLLEYRTDQIVGGVAALLRQGAKASREADGALFELEVAIHHQHYTDDVLRMEDEFFTALINRDANPARQVVAQQLWRAMQHVRGWLGATCYLKPMDVIARALFDAINRHDPRAIEIATQAATHRDPLYMQLALDRVERCQLGNTAAESAVG